MEGCLWFLPSLSGNRHISHVFFHAFNNYRLNPQNCVPGMMVNAGGAVGSEAGEVPILRGVTVLGPLGGKQTVAKHTEKCMNKTVLEISVIQSI